MSGTSEGNKKRAKTMKKKYGEDYYAKIGAIGGKKSTEGGFKFLACVDPMKHKQISAKGGRNSRRTKGSQK